jgi:ATP-dependent protease ClpP protease subunit
MTVKFQCGLDSAKVTIDGAFTQDLALEVRLHMQELRKYWHYDHLNIEINSPGGELLALRALLGEMKSWRLNGGTVATTAVMAAGSAAAVLMVMGDVGRRTVQPYSQLLFHHTRIVAQGENVLTAVDADATAQRLKSADVKIVDSIWRHLAQSHGGDRTAAEVGLARCEAIKSNAQSIVEDLEAEASLAVTFVNGQKRDPQWFRAVVAAYEKVVARGNSTAYTGLLAGYFRLDTRMPVELAWVLQLVDGVTGVRGLQPDTKVPDSGHDQKQSINMAA